MVEIFNDLNSVIQAWEGKASPEAIDVAKETMNMVTQIFNAFSDFFSEDLHKLQIILVDAIDTFMRAKIAQMLDTINITEELRRSADAHAHKAFLTEAHEALAQIRTYLGGNGTAHTSR